MRIFTSFLITGLVLFLGLADDDSVKLEIVSKPLTEAQLKEAALSLSSSLLQSTEADSTKHFKQISIGSPVTRYLGEYAINCKMGTPGQNIYLMIDTFGKVNFFPTR